MGWRDDYKVHPAADVFPMMPDEELAKLGEDIKANGLKHPIVLYVTTAHSSRKDVYDTTSMMLIDGRNRLEAMERVGLSTVFTLCQMQVANDIDNGDPASIIISLNIHRRHLTKQQQADLIVAALKAAAAEELRRKTDGAEPKVSRQDGGKLSKRGRAEGRKVDEIKAKAVATAKEHGISKRTVERALPKGKKPSKRLKRARRRRTEAEIKCDTFREGFLTVVESVGDSAETISDEALEPLTTEQSAAAVETIETTRVKLGRLVDRLNREATSAATPTSTDRSAAA
jgi:hypothetical protein